MTASAKAERRPALQFRAGRTFIDGISRRAHAFAAIVALAVLWEVASWFFPAFLFPSLGSIVRIYIEIVTSWSDFANAGATGLRILAGMMGAFVLGSVIAVLMAKYNRIYDYAFPILNFNQGIPALSWVVFAIIWFHGIEFRIFFIMVMTTLPAFSFQILDAIRSIPKDLMEMSQSFRPSRFDLLRTMILPATVPGILTAWKVNIGNASRVVVVAELVGATGGVGYSLMEQQQNFDMAGAIAWTLVLVTFVLAAQFVISQLEAWLLRYRPKSERTL